MANGFSFEKLYVTGDGRCESVVACAACYGRHIVFKLYLERVWGTEKAEINFKGDEDFGEKFEKTFEMDWAGFENGCDIYSFELDTSDISSCDGGLFFYNYAAYTCYGKRFFTSNGFEPLKIAYEPVFRQLLIYSEERMINTPKGIIYHVFVDRFKNSGKCKIKETSEFNPDWYNGIPEYGERPGAFVKNNTVFGGDLYGVIEKLDYIKSLGTEIIYLSPIFDAYSNHKYDTGDYMNVDSSFGGDKALDLLIKEAEKREMSVLLDGVFNHTGDDSLYFNKYGRYDSVGAYQSKDSKYSSWYTFKDFPDEYSCWWGIKILPRVNCDEPTYRDFICGKKGVIEKWMKKGIRGFRLDVADELTDSFISDIKEKQLKENPDSLLYGEVWENATNKVAYGVRRKYFRGKELDSVMNYPLRKAIISYIKDGNAEEFKSLLFDVYGTYPTFATKLLMNFLGTHDTERIITVLAGQNPDGKSNAELAVMKMSAEERKNGENLVKLAYTILFTVPGIPCVFYGDEIGMEGYHDPFNRRPFPWGREDGEIRNFIKLLSVIRKNNSQFYDGAFSVPYADEDVLVLCRYDDTGGLLTLINRSELHRHVVFDKPVRDLFDGIYSSEIELKSKTSLIVSYSGKMPDFS